MVRALVAALDRAIFDCVSGCLNAANRPEIADLVTVADCAVVWRAAVRNFDNRDVARHTISRQQVFM